jgi:hypothetical protein
MQAHQVFPDPIPESEHTRCETGQHRLQMEYHGPLTCITCEHRINRDGVAKPMRDCPESCFEAFEAEAE